MLQNTSALTSLCRVTVTYALCDLPRYSLPTLLPLLTPLPPSEHTPASVLPVPSAWDTLLPGIRIAHLAQVSVQTLLN